ncbi:MAG: discoidin domain-containing protein [Acidimicrobiales bacterium]
MRPLRCGEIPGQPNLPHPQQPHRGNRCESRGHRGRQLNPAFAATRAIDGDTDTEWATNGDGDDGSITIDLGTTQPIAGVEFLTRSMADGTSITDTYTVTVDDGGAHGPFPAGTVADPRFRDLETIGRRLRFDVETSTGGNVSAVEIRVYGPSG